MKVLITFAQFSSAISGLQRHAFNVVRCLLQQPDVETVHFVVAPWQLAMVRSSGLAATGRVVMHLADMDPSLLSRNTWYYSQLPHLVTQIQPDVVHLSYPVPVHASAMGCPVVVTLHDLYPYEIPENFGFPKVLFNRLILQQCLRSVDAIACVSDTTVAAMKRYTHRSMWDKATRIYNCVEADPACSEDAPLPNWRGEPFLLSVSQHRKNKNIALIIQALHLLLKSNRIRPDMMLVVVGIPGPETDRLLRLVADLRMEQRVLFLHGLAEEALQWCYQNCDLLVAPSQTEGFGLPVAEALLAGCRVVCSDITAFREIDQKHCRFVTLSADAEIHLADAIATSLQQPYALPVALPQFSASVLGAQYVRLYRELMVRNGSFNQAAYLHGEQQEERL